MRRLPAHGGLAVLVAHLLVSPYGLREPTSALAFFLQAAFFVLLVLVLAGVASRRQMAVCLALIGIAAVLRLAAPAEARRLPAVADGALATCCAVAMWMSVSHLLRARRVSAELITASVALYLLAGITWAVAFHAIETAQPGSYSSAGGGAAPSPADLYYFSFVTLTTLGYGDISPVEPIARALAVLEAVFGQIFLVALLGRMVSLQLAPPSSVDSPASRA